MWFLSPPPLPSLLYLFVCSLWRWQMIAAFFLCVFRDILRRRQYSNALKLSWALAGAGEEGSSMVQAMVLAKSQTITIFSDVRTRAFGTDSARTHQTFFADFETPTPKSNEFPLLPAFSTLRISIALWALQIDLHYEIFGIAGAENIRSDAYLELIPGSFRRQPVGKCFQRAIHRKRDFFFCVRWEDSGCRSDDCFQPRELVRSSWVFCPVARAVYCVSYFFLFKPLPALFSRICFSDFSGCMHHRPFFCVSVSHGHTSKFL